MPTVKYPLIYEINTRVWLAEFNKDHHTATLDDIPDHVIQRWKENRFDAIWLMGIWKPSETGRRVALEHTGLWSDYRRALPSPTADDVVASPYSIVSYTPSDALGGLNALIRFKDRIHRCGMKLIVDFVPNHVALDHPWVASHPEYFISAPDRVYYSSPESFYSIDRYHLAHGKDPYFPAWTDTLQLNYANPNLAQEMIHTLKSIAAVADGVRCDMAMLQLRRIFNQTWGWITGEMEGEFWDSAIKEVKSKFPDFLFIGEAYWDTEWNLHQLGFDFTYDKRFYDRLVIRDISALKQHLSAASGFQQKLLRFCENHDEPRAATTFGLYNKVSTLIMATSLGARLLYDGQLEGKRIKLPVQLITQPKEQLDNEVEFFYSKLLRVLDRAEFTRGEFRLVDLQGQSAHVLGFERFAGQSIHRTIILGNFGENDAEVYFFTDLFQHKASYEHLEVISTERYRSPQVDLWPGGITLRLRPAEGLLLLSD